MTADRPHVDWDGATSDRIADPMTRWGSEVLERLVLQGHETVLDAELGETWPGPWTFATAEETAVRLEAAGFVDVETWLHEEPTSIEPGEPLETFLATVVLRSHLDRLPVAERAGYVRAVAECLPDPQIDYVRLNITAKRG